MTKVFRPPFSKRVAVSKGMSLDVLRTSSRISAESEIPYALAQFRQKTVFQFFYAADNLDSEKWDPRSLSNSANLLEKDRIAMLAMEMASRMNGDETDDRRKNEMER